MERVGICKPCEIEGTKKFVKEKEKQAREGKSVQGCHGQSRGLRDLRKSGTSR